MGSTGIRWGWLRFMYIYTIIGAGGAGLAILFAPDYVRELSGREAQSTLLFGLAGSVHLAFAVASLIALRAPVKFAPLLVLQLLYKVISLLGVMVPDMILQGAATHAIIAAAVYLTYIVGDLIAIPFGVVFAKEPQK